ncbi:MAG: proline dehydrogenase family protein, partial [Flavisolibacter sp.]|nr:proline dehydrogenase family protein [Flavisolibacter sp.]
MRTQISFDNTEVAFAHKNDKELKEAEWLFSTMNLPWLVRLGTTLTPWAIRSGLPIRGAVKKTIFRQFVGGETLDETVPVAKKLAEFHVQVILDYGVEGKEGETNFDKARDEFIRVIRFAATQPNVPFMSVKVTGLARHALLEKMDTLMHAAEGHSLINCYNTALQQLTMEELQEWYRVVDRMKDISITAQETGVGFLVDAEESWVQDPVDAVTMVMMDQFNKERFVIYNTVQLYRHDRLSFLEKCYK